MQRIRIRNADTSSKPVHYLKVSAIIDVDIVPDTCRRVKLLKHGSDKPLGFYIRDGTSVRVTPQVGALWGKDHVAQVV